MILALSGLVAVAVVIIAGGIYLSQSQQPVKPTPENSPTDTPSSQPPELNIPDINRLNKSELESLEKKIEGELKELQASKQNSSSDRQRDEIDRAISANEKKKKEITRAIANINAATTGDRDKLEQIKKPVLPYDSIEKLKSIDCSQKPQVENAIDEAIAKLNQFTKTSTSFTEAQDLLRSYTQIKADFLAQCKKIPLPQTNISPSAPPNELPAPPNEPPAPPNEPPAPPNEPPAPPNEPPAPPLPPKGIKILN
jgi:hypothetical protein